MKRTYCWCGYDRTELEVPSRRVFLYHTSRTSLVINHIPIERGVSCGHSQVLFINFGVRTQKIRRAYLNGQIVSEFVSGCLNLNLNFRLNFKYVSEHDVGFPNHYCRPHNSSWIKSYDLSKTPLSALSWVGMCVDFTSPKTAPCGVRCISRPPNAPQSTRFAI